MKTTLQLLRDKIVLQIISYIVFVIISITVIFAMDNYMHKRMIFLNDLLKNETSKTHLNDILKNRIALSRSILLEYINSGSFTEMDNYEKELGADRESISNLLFILERGGVYTEDFRVNYKGLEHSKIKIEYTKYSDSRYSVHVLDLRAKLLEIDHFLDVFRNLVIDKIMAGNARSYEKMADVNSRISVAIKSLDAFYQRLDESGNRLNVKADESEKEVRSYIQNAAVFFRSAKIRTNSVIAVILISAGFVMFVNIFRIVRSRSQFSSELNMLNSNLEETVKKRTEELESEVTVRKKSEEESFSKAKFLMDVIESLGHPFYVIDAQTYEIILANNAAYEVIGNRGRTCYELTHHMNHPCDGIEHPCPLKQVLATGSPTTVEHIHIVRNGERRYFEVHGYPVKDSNGRVVQMIEYSLDITDKKDAEFALINLNSMLEERVAERTKKLEKEIANRKYAEEMVKTRENHFRQLIANISDVIIIVDENMRMTYLSPSIEHITGFNQEQLLGKSFEDLIHSRDRKLFDIWIEKIKDKTDEQRVIEFRMQKRSGQWINGEALAKNMLDSDVIRGIVINVRDITIRKRAEDEIRKLALVMEQNPNSIVVTDIDGNIEYVNPAFEHITGYSLSEVIGQNPRVLKTDHTPKEVFEDLWHTIKAGRVWNGEFVNKKKNEELYIEHAIIAPITNDRGEIVNFLGMKENITELKKAREKAEESNKAKSMFLANMSHEIRTPLNGLIGFLDLLNQTKLDGEQKEYVSTIKYSADTLLSVLNDVLDLSKIESGMLELENSDIDLSYNVLLSAKAFYARAAEKGINIYTYIDPQIPHVLKGDSLRLNQVLSNLLGNALKFTPQGGVVRVNAELVKDTKKESRISFSVEDSGVGIPQDKLDSIFESFAQVDTSVTRKYGGTGLGLTITKNLLKLMGSEIKVESREGEGSRFFFEIKFQKSRTATMEARKVDRKVIICGSGSPEYFALLERYLKALNADYAFTDSAEIPDDASGCTFIFSQKGYDSVQASSVSEKGGRVVFVIEEFTNQSIPKLPQDAVKLRRPFSGALFYEALTGQSVWSAQQQDDSADRLTFSGRVLVAEDSPVNIKLMETMLHRLGIETDIVQNGQDAYELCCQNRYDLVLMDINMPEMDGVTAAGKIREYESRFYKTRTPVVALTAHSFSEMDDMQFIGSDFDGCLTKPVNMTDLEYQLRKFLSDEDAEQEERQSFSFESTVAQIGLDSEVVRNLLNGFVDYSRENIEKLKKMLKEGDFGAMSAVVQSDRSASDNLRLNVVSAIYNDIEMAVRLKNKGDILKSVIQLENELAFISESMSSGV